MVASKNDTSITVTARSISLLANTICPVTAMIGIPMAQLPCRPHIAQNRVTATRSTKMLSAMCHTPSSAPSLCCSRSLWYMYDVLASSTDHPMSKVSLIRSNSGYWITISPSGHTKYARLLHLAYGLFQSGPFWRISRMMMDVLMGSVMLRLLC